MIPGLDQRPVIVTIAGPNGAGKSTFFAAHLQAGGLRLVNADVLAAGLSVDPYHAAKLAQALREKLLVQKESFAFETVFSDPAGEKVGFLQKAAAAGYNVILCFIGIDGPTTSEQRVAMRVTQGGHDVPIEKLQARFPRTLDNLMRAVKTLPHVFVFDNEDLANPYRQIAIFHNGQTDYLAKSLPRWMQEILRQLKD